jgi:3-(3-hydroxy-phenyl)propionate hydroxylase
MSRASLDDVRLAPFRAAIGAWLDRRDADAVLVRPDRYVFGAGPAYALENAFASQVMAAAPGCPPLA